MLFVQSKISSAQVDDALRLAVLDRLQTLEATPLIRSARLWVFEAALAGSGSAAALEQRLAAPPPTAGGHAFDQPYTRGEVFCAPDHALFIIFGDATSEDAGVRVGIVYDSSATDATGHLDRFVQQVQAALLAVVTPTDTLHLASSNGHSGSNGSTPPALQSEFVTVTRPHSLSATSLNTGSPVSSWLSTPVAQLTENVEGLTENERSTLMTSLGGSKSRPSFLDERRATVLQTAEARAILHRLLEAQAGGRVIRRRASQLGTASEATAEYWISELNSVGLLRREVLVSCHKTGNGLFRLPSLDALTMISSSGALCHECGMPIGESKAEEIIAPTPLAATLLDGGAWLVSQVRHLLGEMSIADSQIATQSLSDDLNSLIVEIYDETFLVLLRDGDWTPRHTRSALELAIETGATHLVSVITGKVQPEARVALLDRAPRLHRHSAASSDGRLQVIICDGFEYLADRLSPVLEQLSLRAVCAELSWLDSSLGFSVGEMLAASFELRHAAPETEHNAVTSSAILPDFDHFPSQP